MTAAGSVKVQWTSDHNNNTTTAAAAAAAITPVGALTWLKTSFDAPADWEAPEALALDLTGATKGHVYINGFDAGRYWVRATRKSLTRRPRPRVEQYFPALTSLRALLSQVRDPVISTFYQLPPDNLKPTGNLLVLWEEVGSADISTIKVVRRSGRV